MTTGERLVSLSTLGTGTALDHFLNLQTGGGGVDVLVETILEADVMVDNMVCEVEADNMVADITEEVIGCIVYSTVDTIIQANIISDQIECLIIE